MRSTRPRLHRTDVPLLCQAVAVALLIGIGGISPAVSHAARPNVILIMVDDLGCGDLSCYGSQKQNTPVLDQMAKEGVKLTSFYAGATVCSPSRMALLSGAYPSRVGWEGGVMGYGMPAYGGLSRDVLTIAEAFKQNGYRTAISGKWHIGKRDLAPMHQGFDQAYYLLFSNNQTKKLWRGDEVIANPFDNRRLTELFTEEAIRFIREESDKPFFLYLPYTAPHFPAQAHPDWKGHSSNGAYGDVVEELDGRLGEIFALLKKKEIDKNTIVVFLSDNGAEPGQRKFSSSEPYAGRKWSAREGGTRVPCIIRWPGVIEPRTQSDDIVAAIDLFPTLADACGVELEIPEEGQKLDGVSVWDSLVGKDVQHPRSDLLYWHGWGEARAIRQRDWKLYFGEEEGVPGTDKGPALFNLSDDLQETKNLADEHPEKVNELMALAKEQLEDIYAHATPIGAEEDAQDKIKDWQPKKKWGKWLK